MKSTRSPLTVLVSCMLAACASGGGSAPPATPNAAGDMASSEAAAESSTESATMASAGGTTFSDEQADRGRDIFRAACTECHYSSEFSDSQFKFKWSRRSAGGLYQLIQTSMPETAPGSLSAAETVDIVSYIMRMNGFEPGAAELSADRAVLDGISLASIRN